MRDRGLNAFYESDPGFKQFVDRHGTVAGDPDAIKEYNLWLMEERLQLNEYALREARGYDKGLAEGLAEGEAKGLAEGEAKGLAEGEAKILGIALKAFQKARPGEDLSAIAQLLSDFGIPPDVIQTAREQVEGRASRRKNGREPKPSPPNR